MLIALICAALGALGGAWARRSLHSLIPGASLALIWCVASSVRVEEIAWWAVVGALPLGFVLCRVCDRGRDKLVDFPLDSRLFWALIVGFLVRGTLVVALNVLE